MAAASITYDYRGARVLVTGGTSGIGHAIASGFRDAGADVSITGTRASTSEYDIDLSDMSYHQLAVEDRDALYAMRDTLPQLDILINNAGATTAQEWDADAFDHSLRVNLGSVFHLSQALLPALRESGLPGGASIIGIASMSSFFGMEVVPGYGAAKAALVQHIKTLAVTEAKHGVRANAVAAGLVLSRMTSAVKDIPGADSELMANTPMQRWGDAREIADAVLFLTSERASYLTGQTINVDGGFSISG